MAKPPTSRFVCQTCGAVHRKWSGKCDDCGAWNSIVEEAAGHEALCVSHQLPIWTARSFATGRRLWHDPRKRQCALASLTSFTFTGDDLVTVSYEEPARDLLPVPAPGTGKKFVAGA